MAYIALLLCLQAEIDRDVAGQRGFDASRAPGLAGDGVFLRRASLDLTGAPPSADEARAFLDDPEPDKRTRLIDRLIGSEAFARTWARGLSGMLLGEADALPFSPGHPLPAELRGSLVRNFEAWLVQAIRQDMPWDAIVTELLVSRGGSDASPAVAWKLSFRTDMDPFPRAFAGYMPKQILGIDMRCAVCHDHPFDKWSLNDTYDLMSFLPALSVRVDADPLRAHVEPDYLAPLPAVQGIAPAPRLFVGGRAKPGEDRLEALARLATASPQFDRAAANRIWAWMLGRGVVHPPDDFNVRHRPSSPALLSTLEKEFRRTGRSIKAFVRSVALTRAYQRSSAGELPMAQLIRPLEPEVLVGALQTATLGAPRGGLEEARRIVGSSTLGRVRGCEIAASPCGTLQALFLRNSEELWGWIADGPVLRAVRSSKDPLEELFLAVLSRRPSADERARFGRFLDGTPDTWADGMWVLLNSTEFLMRG